MLFLGNIWTVYGIGLPQQMEPPECIDCTIAFTDLQHTASSPTVSTEIPVLATSHPPTSIEDIPRYHDEDIYTSYDSTSQPSSISSAAPLASNNDTQPQHPTPQLSTAVKVSLGISIVVFILLLALVVIGVPHLRKYRQARALQRAVEEVERGIEMQQSARQEDVTTAENKEHMVLESRVEIVVDDGESELDVVDAWDAWNASWEDEEEEVERGRKGMSLPRRES
ncbi:hypothetical protein GQ44DRAFT_823303 [Phaeosphaeriaceae sp. PMI808]|nr:hypothetical protein GQ44DRAFT_823303 [Phaeosphaeriaceae sp. PMI808]